MKNFIVIYTLGVMLDAQERVENVTNLEGQRLDVTYLICDLVSSVDRFDGVLVSNIFDNAGNVTETLHDGVSIEQASYRRNGQLSSLSNAVATFNWSYDIRGFATNVQSTVGSLQSAVDYRFDPMGNTIGVLWNVGSGTLDVAYGYDEAERLSVITPNPSSSLQLPTPFTLSYNQWNGLLASVSNEHITASHTYNILDVVTNTVYKDVSGNQVACFDYKHDVLGLITQKVTVVDGNTVTNSYTYDKLGRLTSETLTPSPSNSPTPICYTYDLAGNRLSVGGSNCTYTHNKLDGVLHDTAGNITNMVRNGVTLDMSWNSQGQLVSVITNGVFAESYTWSPLGNRLSTTDASGVTYHAYDGDHCIADVNASGNIIASYTWGIGIDNLLAVTVYENGSTNVYYAIKDHLNSVHALIDDSGNVVWSCSYSAWGTPLNSQLSIINSQLSIINSQFKLRYLFQGREYSQATGLYNFRARWYDSNIGRWLSKDPIGLEGGLNLYVFCGNNPVNFVDPWGECEEDLYAPPSLSELWDSILFALGEKVPQTERERRAAMGASLGMMAAMSTPSPNVSFGIPKSTLGPSGKPKIIVKLHSTLKRAKDAARGRAGKGGGAVKHPTPTNGNGHYHGVKRNGTKVRIHDEYPQ